MIQNADTANDLSHFVYAVENVGWITIDLLASGHLISRPNSNGAPILKDNFVYRFVEHVGATVNGAQSSKPLRQLAKSIEWVQVGTLAIASQRFTVQLDSINQIEAWLGKVSAIFKQQVRKHNKTRSWQCLTRHRDKEPVRVR